MIRKIMILCLFNVCLSGCSLLPEEKSMVIVIPSFNNESWYKKNLDSVFAQNYQNYRVIYIDDASCDQTFKLVQNYIRQSPHEHKFTLIKNESRQKSLSNLYKAIHSCNDTEIIILLDGDDWLAHPNVLKSINKAYTLNNIWLTYSQFRYFPSGELGNAAPFSQDIIDRSAFRKIFPFPFAPVRTFYAWLFKKINKNDLLDDEGKFFAMAGDVAMMMPMAEMAVNHLMFVPEILYIYNLNSPINDRKISRKQQHATSVFIREKRSKYMALD